MVGRMGGGLHFLVEIELKMAKMPAFTNLKWQTTIPDTLPDVVYGGHGVGHAASASTCVPFSSIKDCLRDVHGVLHGILVCNFLMYG